MKENLPLEESHKARIKASQEAIQRQNVSSVSCDKRKDTQRQQEDYLWMNGCVFIMHDVNLSGKHHKTVENKQIEH